MQYTYRCPDHGEFDDSARADWWICGVMAPLSGGTGACGLKSKRVWGFVVDSSFEPYFAPSFGCVVNSRTHAKDLAKIASEEATIKTGIAHDFQVIDTHDDAAAGVDTEHKLHVLAETKKANSLNAAQSAERQAEITKAKQAVDASRVAVDA